MVATALPVWQIMTDRVMYVSTRASLAAGVVEVETMFYPLMYIELPVSQGTVVLLVVPSSPWIGKGLGCLAELRLGARPCERAGDVFEVLDAMGAQLIRPPSSRRPSRSGSKQRSIATDLPPLEGSALLHQVCQLIADGAREVDEVADLAGLPVSIVNRVLLTLRLQGVLVSAASGQLSLLKSSD